MSKDYTQKIRSLLNQSNQTVPYIFQRFYTLLKKITISIPQNKAQPKIFQQYSNIFRTIKKYIKDQPYLLIQASINNYQKIQKQLKNLINPLLVYLEDDVLSKAIEQYFLDKETNEKLLIFINNAQKVKQQLTAKNVKIKVFGTHELANCFWVRKFKSEYAVHFDTFWAGFLEFIEQIPFFQYFISTSSKRSIMKKVDPQKKYFITSSNVSQLFYKLGQPQFLQRLADQTAKGSKSNNFVSKDFLQLQFYPLKDCSFQTSLIEGQIFEISGQDTLISDHRNKSKHAPTIIFGSGADSDIKIKNKYISRKQFMLIQQDQNILFSNINLNLINPSSSSFNNQQKHKLPFSLVCLSSSNFTMVSYQRKQKLKVGMIFKVGDHSIQVVKIQNCLKQVPNNSSIAMKKAQSIVLPDQSQEQQDETLQYLPIKSTHQISDQKQLQYIFLLGAQKGKKGKLTKQSIKIPQIQNLLSLQYQNDQYYLPAQTKIYVKTANQVINGELSNKISIEEGMKIFLEECYFYVK